MTYRIDLRETLAAMNSERQRLGRRYQCSDRFITDAREWIATGDLSDVLIRRIFIEYNQSSAFRTVIDDAEAGEVRW